MSKVDLMYDQTIPYSLLVRPYTEPPNTDGSELMVLVNIPQDSFMLQLPIRGTGMEINWGDGNVNTYTQTSAPTRFNLIQHTYSQKGLYWIRMKNLIQISWGSDTYFSVHDGVGITSNERNSYIKFHQWGSSNNWLTTDLTPFRFQGLTNLEFDAVDIPQNISSIKRLTMAFDMTSFNQDISNWNVSSVTRMDYLFRLTPFNQPLNNWNVSSVTNMHIMFGSTPFNQPLNNWNVSSVTNMQSMFSNSSFNQDISGWNTANVTNMQTMFSNSSFNQDISGWNISKVKTLAGMFFISSFNQDLSALDISNVTSILGMFEFSNYNQPLNWNTSNITNMSRVFKGTPFNQDISGWDTSNVTEMRRMFQDNEVFNQNLSGWNVSNVTSYLNFDTNTPAWTLPKPNFI